MNFEWQYFKPREIGFGIKEKAIACKIQEDKSIIYWVVDKSEGLKKIKISGDA